MTPLCDQVMGHFFKEYIYFALTSFRTKQFGDFVDIYIRLHLSCLNMTFFPLESPSITLEMILYTMNMCRFDIPGS